MPRAQDKRTIFYRKLAYGFRHVTRFARQALQLVHDASRAIQRAFNLGRDRGWRRRTRRDLGGFLFHFLERLHLLENLGDDFVLLVLVE